jgi:hypothetical protein
MIDDNPDTMRARPLDFKAMTGIVIRIYQGLRYDYFSSSS